MVIHRLPRMLDRQWRLQCAEYQPQMAVPPNIAAEQHDATPYHLALPGSHCPHCQNPLSIGENLPLVSFLWLRGRCRACQKPISWRYPAVETLAAIGAVVVIQHFGVSIQAVAALGFTWTLLAAAVIDLEHQLLPDILTLPLMWAGLALSIGNTFVAPPTALIGAMAGYISLWMVYWSFRLFTGKEGMGYGDFKLLAALGAWLGWANLPMVVLLSSLLGAIVGISMVIFAGHEYQRPIPFGPFLALAGWIALIWNQAL